MRSKVVFQSLLIILPVIAIGTYLFASGASEPPKEAEDKAVSDPEMMGALALQIPLEETAEARAQFSAEFKAHIGFDLRALYEKYIDQIGANGIVVSLNEARPICHDEAHDLGRLIYDRTRDVSTALRTCEDVCYSGCMHGVVMGLFSEPYADEVVEAHVMLEEAKEQMGTICDSGDITGTYDEGDCAHGVGHALMFMSEYRIDLAIDACDAFDTYQMDYYCATGAYMEYMNVKEVEDAKTQDVFYPCDSTPYPAACFRYKMTRVVGRHYQQEKSFGELVAACSALDETARLGCFHGIGNGHFVYIVFGELTVAQLCDPGTKDDQYVCIEGAMERLARYYPDTAAAQCETLDGWKKDLCEEVLVRQMYSLEKPFDLYQR